MFVSTSFYPSQHNMCSCVCRVIRSHNNTRLNLSFFLPSSLTYFDNLTSILTNELAILPYIFYKFSSSLLFSAEKSFSHFFFLFVRLSSKPSKFLSRTDPFLVKKKSVHDTSLGVRSNKRTEKKRL